MRCDDVSQCHENLGINHYSKKKKSQLLLKLSVIRSESKVHPVFYAYLYDFLFSCTYQQYIA